MSPPHCVSGGESDACADLLFPHTTTIWYDDDDDDEASFWSLSPTAFACETMPPIPSPPPTISTVGRSDSPNRSRMADLSMSARASFWTSPAASPPATSESDPNLQNPLRIGRPYCTILDESTFLSSAASLNTSEGTKHLSTPPLNHEGWAPPRSVTTVTKGVVLAPALRDAPSVSRYARTFRGRDWQRGWTDTTMSALLPPPDLPTFAGSLAMHSLNGPKHISSNTKSYRNNPRGVAPVS